MSQIFPVPNRASQSLRFASSLGVPAESAETPKPVGIGKLKQIGHRESAETPKPEGIGKLKRIGYRESAETPKPAGIGKLK